MTSLEMIEAQPTTYVAGVNAPAVHGGKPQRLMNIMRAASSNADKSSSLFMAIDPDLVNKPLGTVEIEPGEHPVIGVHAERRLLEEPGLLRLLVSEAMHETEVSEAVVNLTASDVPEQTLRDAGATSMAPGVVSFALAA